MCPLFERHSLEKKEIILMSGFTINVLNYDADSETSDTMYSNSFYPTGNTLTRITALSKTLTDNINLRSYKDITAGNITTSILDHPTQFIFIYNRHSDTARYKLKQIQPLRELNKKLFKD